MTSGRTKLTNADFDAFEKIKEDHAEKCFHALCQHALDMTDEKLSEMARFYADWKIVDARLRALVYEFARRIHERKGH